MKISLPGIHDLTQSILNVKASSFQKLLWIKMVLLLRLILRNVLKPKVMESKVNV